MCVLFAATYPERTAALVLRSAYPRAMWAPDYPWGRSEEEYRREVERDLHLVTDGDPASLEDRVPDETEVFPADLGLSPRSRP